MEGAGDVLAHVLGERVAIRDQCLEVDAAAGETAEHEIAQPRHRVENAGDQPGLDRVGAGELVEAADAIGEADREGRRAEVLDRPIRHQLDDAAEAVHQSQQVDLLAGEVELDAGRGGGVGLQGDFAARLRLEQRGIEVGDRGAERVPRGLAVRRDVHVARRRAREAGRIAEAGHRVRSHCRRLAGVAPQMGGDEQQRVVLQVAADAGQVGDHVDAEGLEIGGRADAGAQQHGRRMEAAGT